MSHDVRRTPAVRQVIEHKIVPKHFKEATCVMKRTPHKHVLEHFEKLTKDPKLTAEFLQNLKLNSSFTEYQPILGYLSYWGKEQH